MAAYLANVSKWTPMLTKNGENNINSKSCIANCTVNKYCWAITVFSNCIIK